MSAHIITIVGFGLLLGSPVLAIAAHQDAADFLYQLAEEHRRAGRVSEAAREYRETLILNPKHSKARSALALIDSTPAGVQRKQVMESVLNQAVREQSGLSGQEAVVPVVVAVDSENTSWARVPRAAGAYVRVPDIRSNGTRWLYVFGKEGKPEFGALAEAQRIYIDVPAGSTEPVSVRVIDADIRGRYDEVVGSHDTSTTFRLLSADRELESQSVTAGTADHAVVTLGPVDPSRGEAVGEHRRFCVEAAGGSGDDNNLFALEVRPSSAECFSQQPAIRLADSSGSRMEFYPEVPQGTTQVLEEHNYDLDPDGGRAALVPVTGSGRQLPAVPLATSGTGAWAKTPVNVPTGTDGSRWKYRITKHTQEKGNMAFRVNDQQGRPLPVYFTRNRARATAPVSQQAQIAETQTCNEFTFDGSKSYDPDKDTLSYMWDFGDGSTAEGMIVEHAYTQAGNYTVKLKVKDSTTTTCCASETEQVVPVNMPPKPAIEAPERTCSGTSVRLNAAKSTDSPGETLTYHWDFGDGTTGSSADVEHVYASGGTRRITLTIDDGRGTACSKAQASTEIRVNSPPIVKANEAVQVCAAGPSGVIDAAFSAAGSRDPDGDQLNFSWDFGDGSRGSGENASHAYQKGGRYTATVTADDGTGSLCSTGTAVVPVSLNHPPVAFALPASASCPDTLTTFNGSGSTDADGQPLSLTWDFGDGHSGEGATLQHAYTTTGKHTARLTVRDNSGMACNTASVEVPVFINAPPVAAMTIRGGRRGSSAAAKQ